MKSIETNILKQLKSNLLSQQEAFALLKELKQNELARNDEIAIIGASCRLPMSNSRDDFWENISNGRNCLISKPAEKLQEEEIFINPYYAEMFNRRPFLEEDREIDKFVGAFIEDYDKFDANFFNIPPREAKYMDPQQRIFLEAAWTAIEDAGYGINIKDTLTGVFVGRDGTNSCTYKYYTEYDPMSLTGNWEGILASRISYIYNLRGPAMVIDTACSSGLVAMHEACNSLRNEECDMAIAGGISIGAAGANTEIENNDNSDKGASAILFSNDNRVHTFDNKSSGTVFGEGVVAFLLKPLKKAIEDRDNIYGIIRGSAINNDGASNGITAPNPTAQEEVIINAWKRAKISPENISYIECHGTGTLLGDPIEVLGLKNAFGRYTDKKQFCGIGSVKTNIGHTVGAAGCANVLKVILAMNHNIIPASLYFEEPNQYIDFVDSSVYVVDKAIEWKRGDHPRIAGVSSFGFSGTNAHMVIEEPGDIKVEKRHARKNNIISISAKTEKALLSLINNYNAFLKDKHDLNIEDICFTANTGRGHYSYRVAIIIRNLDDLKVKIGRLCRDGLKSMAGEQVYYGKNIVVSDKRTQKSEGELSESELRDITQNARTITDEIKDNPGISEDPHSLAQLCELYVRGANIDWNQLYSKDGDIRKISLPTYPFDRTPFWGDQKTTKVEGSFFEKSNSQDQGSIKHPLIERCLAESAIQSIYLVKFSLKKHWPLQEHTVLDVNIVSGTTFIDILIKVLRHSFDTEKILLQNIVFLNPLVVRPEDDEIETHVIIGNEDVGKSFLVASKYTDENGIAIWKEHIKGKAQVCNEQAANMPAMDKISSAENVEEIEVVQITTCGERWNCTEKIYSVKDDNTAFYSIIKLPEKYLADLDGYDYHPGMFDAAINKLMFQLFTGTYLYLPYTYKNMKVFKSLTDCFYSKVVKINKDNDSEILTFNVSLADKDGSVIALIEECTIKKVNKLFNYVAGSYYGVKWEKQQPEKHDITIPRGNMMIIRDKSGLSDLFADTVRSRDNKICFVTYANKYCKVDDTHYEISGEEEDYHRLLQDTGNLSFTKVYDFGTIDLSNKDAGFDECLESMKKGLYSFVYLTKSFTKRAKGNVDFILISDYAHIVNEEEDCIKAANTSYLALAKALRYECPNFLYRCIDIDAHTGTQTIIEELLRSDENTFRVAYRHNERYTELLSVVDTTKAKKKVIELKTEGVYLITGGTGGLGLEVALNFSEYCKCNICLLARSKVPARSDWDSILSKNENNKKYNMVKVLKKIEENGCNVIIKNCDISDYAQMGIVLNELKEKYGSIIGIIHCAGVAGDGFLFNKPMEVFNNVVHPKILGTMILDQLTRDQKLDFFILFSSMQTLIGGPGQSDYTAANAFLDCYAAYMQRKGIQAQAINWPGWSETGMAADYNISETATFFKSLNTQTAIGIFNDTITTDLSNIIPGNINIDFLARLGESNLPIKLSEKLGRDLRRYQLKSGVKAEQKTRTSIDLKDLVIIGRSSEEFSEIEKKVAYIYASVLNLKEIDIFESFNSMGGDSIIATEVLNVLNQQFGGILNISDMFTYSCVEEMASHISSLLNEKPEEKAKTSFNDMMEKFESGDVDVNSMIDYFDSDNSMSV